jgi:hypothetical protein
MRFSMLLAGAMVLTAVAARPILAQDEARLRKALEGKRITLKMDMPATQDGVDVYPGTNRAVDYEKVGKRMKKEGVAIKDGESARITKVKVKEEHIEIQLNGGGYGTFGDALGRLKNQDADSGTAQQMRYQNERTEKLAGGSRFNLRYPNGVDTDDATAAAVIQALDEYATFPPGIVSPVPSHATYSSASTAAPVSAPSPPSEQVRKGMSSADVTGAIGSPSSGSTNGPVTTSRYRTTNGSLEVDFVNDVAVAVRQLPASSGQGIRKGLSLQEVEQIAGKSVASKTINQMMTNKYNWQDGILEADFFNGVLVAYRTSSR